MWYRVTYRTDRNIDDTIKSGRLSKTFNDQYQRSQQTDSIASLPSRFVKCQLRFTADERNKAVLDVLVPEQLVYGIKRQSSVLKERSCYTIPSTFLHLLPNFNRCHTHIAITYSMVQRRVHFGIESFSVNFESCWARLPSVLLVLLIIEVLSRSENLASNDTSR